MAEEFYTTKEVAEKLKVDVRTVRRWLDNGKIDGFKAGTRWRIPAEEYKKIIQGKKFNE